MEYLFIFLFVFAILILWIFVSKKLNNQPQTMIVGQKMIEIQNKNNDLINAYHEIGHLFIASLWNFKVKKISIRDRMDPKTGIFYGKFTDFVTTIENLIDKNEYIKLDRNIIPDDEHSEFLIKYLQSLTAGNVCEELYKNNFDVNNLKNDIPTTDKLFYQYLYGITGLNETNNYMIIAVYLKNVECLIHRYAKLLYERVEFSELELYEFQKEIKAEFQKNEV